MGFKKGNIPWNKNKKGCFSEETKKKLSDATKGENNPNYKGLITLYCIICGKEMLLHPFESYRKYCSHKCQGVDCLGEKNPAKRLESRKKISIKHKGKFVSEETKRKISVNHADLSGSKHPLYGTHCSEETKLRIGNGNRGKVHPHTEEYKKCASERNKGPLNPNWKDGASFKPYCPKFNNAIKTEIREIFGNVCLLCGLSEQENVRRNNKPIKLDVHHVFYDKEDGCNDNDFILVPLCRRCHIHTNAMRELWPSVIIYMILHLLVIYHKEKSI